MEYILRKICIECNNEFETTKKDKKFCSRKCYGEYRSKIQLGDNNPYWKGGKFSVICKTCGKEFFVYNRSKDKHSEYCSTACKPSCMSGIGNGNWKGSIKSYKCTNCNREFKRYSSWIKTENIFCSRRCSSIWTLYNMKKSDTSIELKVEQELIRLDIDYKKQVRISNIGIPDFVINDNIIVQCDGDYWHSLPKTIEKDKVQNIKYKELGYTVLRFWEHEIHKELDKCINSILEHL